MTHAQQSTFERGPEEPIATAELVPGYDYDEVEASLAPLPPPVQPTLPKTPREKIFDKLILTVSATLLVLITVRIIVPQAIELQPVDDFGKAVTLIVMNIIALCFAGAGLLFFWKAGN